MHNHLAMRDQFQGSEERLAGNVLAQETARPGPQCGDDVLGLLRGGENDRLHARIRRDYLAHKALVVETLLSTPVNHTQALSTADSLPDPRSTRWRCAPVESGI